jgi:flagellar biosynthesis protein FlhF
MTQASPGSPFGRWAYAPKESDAPEHAPPAVVALRAELRAELRALKAQLPAGEATPTELLAELAGLRALLEDALEPRKGDRFAALLRARGIEGAAAKALTRAMKPSEEPPEVQLREALAEVLRVAPWPLAGKGRAVVALVGPTGVGKTTTCAKLAAHARMEGRTVTLLGCDGFRVGAQEQLRRYGTLLGARVAMCASREELGRAITEADTDLVLVDTAGSAPAPRGVESLLASDALGALPGARGRAREVLLCVPAALRAVDAAGVVRAFGVTQPTALAVLKLDETRSPAGLLHASAAARLPVSVLCAGQRVPEHIAPATAAAVLDLFAPQGAARGAVA